MLIDEEEKVLKSKKRLFYIPYPFLLAHLWFADGNIWVGIAVTMVVIYVMGHQGYFFYRKEKLENIQVGF